jgi:hypothetical protein
MDQLSSLSANQNKLFSSVVCFYFTNLTTLEEGAATP